MHPSSNIEREYVARVHGNVTDNIIEKLVEGVDLEDPREDVVVGEDALPRWGPVLLERDLNLDEELSDLLNHL